MDGTEMDTIIFKFKQLCRSGLEAHLDLDTKAGQAWVGLRVRLGHLPGPLYQHKHFYLPQRTRNSPSRQRRCARRAAERQEQAEEVINNVEIEKEAEDAPNDIHENGNVVIETTLDTSEDNLAEDATDVIRNSVVYDEFCTNEKLCDFRFVITNSVLKVSKHSKVK